ncbi:MAG: DUF885 domain-containing protein [Lachnospiraceae bacterium]
MEENGKRWEEWQVWFNNTVYMRISDHLMSVLMLICCGYLGFHIYQLAGKLEEESVTTQVEISAFEQHLQDLFVSVVQQDALTLQYTLKNPEQYGIRQAEQSGIGSISLEEFQKYYQKWKDERIILLNFDSAQLSEKEKLTYDILMDWIQTTLDGEQYMMYQESWGSTTGTQAQLPILLAEYPLEDEEDIETYLVMLQQVDDYLLEMLAWEQLRTEEGLGMTDAEIERVVNQCQIFAETGDSCCLIDSFAERLDEISGLRESQKTIYEEKNREIVETQVLTGYETVAQGLNRLKTGADGGLCRLPDGQDYYSWLMTCETGSDKTVAEMKTAIYNRIKDDLLTMSTICSANPEVAETSGQEVFSKNEPELVLEDLKKKMLDYFPEGADVSYTVKTVPKSMENYLSPAFYITPRLDVATENVIYINEGKNGYGTVQNYSVLAHEGYPGHLYQTTYFNGTNPYEIRSLLNYAGYIEGWATYAEQYAYELSQDFSSEVSKMKELSSVVTLGLYALMDIGVHYDGWNRETLAEFVKTYFGLEDEDTANDIYDIILEDPAGYLSYYGGYLEIMELKEEMKSVWGDEFTEKRFHQNLLEIGPASFSVIKRNMED